MKAIALTLESPEDERYWTHFWKALNISRSLLRVKAANAGSAQNC